MTLKVTQDRGATVKTPQVRMRNTTSGFKISNSQAVPFTHTQGTHQCVQCLHSQKHSKAPKHSGSTGLQDERAWHEELQFEINSCAERVLFTPTALSNQEFDGSSFTYEIITAKRHEYKSRGNSAQKQGHLEEKLNRREKYYLKRSS